MQYFFFLFLLFLNDTLLAQNDYRDSLTIILKQSSQPKRQLKKLGTTEKSKLNRSIISNKLGVLYQKEGKLDSAYKAHQQALQLALAASPNNEEIAISYNKIGIIHYYNGHYDSAAYFFDLSIPFYQKAQLKANSLNNLALMNKYRERPDLAIQNYLAALQIYHQEQDSSKQLVILNNIGSLYFALEDYKFAANYHHKALNLALAIHNKEDEFLTKANLANLAFKQKEYTKAIAAYQEIISYFETEQQHSFVISNKNNLANCYDAIGQKQEALTLYLEVLDLMEQEEFFSNKEAILSNIGDLYQEKKDFAKAVYYYQNALAFAQQNKIVLRYEPIYERLSIVYKALNDIDSSLYFKNQQLALRDSLDRVEKEKKMMELESQYQNKTLNNNLHLVQEELEQTHYIKSLFSKGLFITLVLSFVFLTTSLIVYKRYVKKKAVAHGLANLVESKDQEIAHLNSQKSIEKHPYPSGYTPLTNREKEVLLALQEGLKDQEIAQKLFISITTVRTHLRKSYAKIGVRNRAEAVLFVTQHQL